MPIGEKDHQRITIAVAVLLGRVDQLLDLVIGQVLAGPQLLIRKPLWCNCPILVVGATSRRCDFAMTIASVRFFFEQSRPYLASAGSGGVYCDQRGAGKTVTPDDRRARGGFSGRYFGAYYRVAMASSGGDANAACRGCVGAGPNRTPEVHCPGGGCLAPEEAWVAAYRASSSRVNLLLRFNGGTLHMPCTLYHATPR